MKSSLAWELQKAKKNKYAIPAFNFDNLEMLKAIIKAAELENAPIIIMATEGAVNYIGENYVTAIGKQAMMNAKIPVILHWDHGQTFYQAKQLIHDGFTSVMLDVSKEEKWFNIEQTKKLVAHAHQRGVCVESEIGHVGGKEDLLDSDFNFLTKVEDAVEFVKATNVDALAISVGSTHGIYKSKPNLNFKLISEIASKVSVPLVLHGGSGIPDQDLVKAIEHGISKINIGTDLKIINRKCIEDYFVKHPKEYDHKKMGTFIIDSIIEFVRRKIRVCGATNQAIIT